MEKEKETTQEAQEVQVEAQETQEAEAVKQPEKPKFSEEFIARFKAYNERVKAAKAKLEKHAEEQPEPEQPARKRTKKSQED